MSLGRPIQPDRCHYWDDTERGKLKRQKRMRWFSRDRKFQLRRERRRAKTDPECLPEYGKHAGYD